MVGRDDLQGRIAGDLLAERWGNKPIAILHDGQAYGKGFAEETKKRLNERGIAEAMFEAIEPGEADYRDLVEKIQAEGIEVLYFGGYQHQVGLIIRQAREHGYELQLVGGDAMASEDFGLIAGPAADGTLMTLFPSPSGPEVAEFSAKFTEGFRPPLTTYAAFQAWAQAVERAGTFDTAEVADALRAGEFDTILGRIGFDAKGDVTGYDTFAWYVWKDGTYALVEPGKLTE
jgi:branched-chain amino acid transport system substrate-binding protein